MKGRLASLADHWVRYASMLFQPLEDGVLERRDAAFIEAELDVLGRLTDAWFAPEVEGLAHVPDGPSLVVGTHNGGIMAPDMFSLMVAFWRHFGAARPAYGLAHDRAFDIPGVGRWLYRVGAVPAHQAHARELLGRGAVVPVVSVGAHETFRVLTDGHELARAVGLKRLFRIDVLPIILSLPLGLTVGPFEAHVPTPSKVRIRVLPPIDLALPRDPDDHAIAAARERIRATMQAALDELVAEGGFGPLARLAPP